MQITCKNGFGCKGSWEDDESLKGKGQAQLGAQGMKHGRGLLAALLGPVKRTEWQARTDLRLQSHTLRTPVMFPLTSLLSPSERRSPRAHGLFALSGGRNKFVIIFGEWWQ